ANTSAKLCNVISTEMVSLTKLDDGPLRLRQIEFFLNVVLSQYGDSGKSNLQCIMTGMTGN
ncbi:MAG: hypothetical protein QN717_07255, partial [Nitrososphaeraceae archaeon]|nr:hypothetical protein [Nitrososphaeraceae archaeon]